MSSQKAEATIWWLSLLLTFTVVLVQPRLGQALAQLLPPIPLGIIPYFPGLLPPATAPTPLQCWSSLLNIHGCIGEIYVYFEWPIWEH
ncbi:hypothetical protein ES332_A08G106000v1 [Gossypium tomentosum]|uniref:Uncharacterized protein n=1 Tax=Gossypium tomentosum TaxID=34277 RepID=A0A5D2PE49_GOSTO|nr:hypothetical protein ES332_A08G106000v1 [Gossypium tomentosum]